ncbi:MAG: redoxin domain-containing protein [Bacteroidota bacterium]|nr:redoxin domain-containing protein [Bacteroidota bacterium]
MDNQSFVWTNGIHVFYFLNTECPICQKYQGQFKKALDSFENINVYYVFCGQQNLTEIEQFAQYDSIPYHQILLDKNYELAKTLKATVTPQVIVSMQTKILYSGKIDNRFETLGSYSQNPTINYLNNALISLRKNETIQEPYIQPVGCFIEPH